jgi:hypothetical protein
LANRRGWDARTPGSTGRNLPYRFDAINRAAKQVTKNKPHCEMHNLQSYNPPFTNNIEVTN